jgi:CRP-like cAMP-binding protein
MIPMKNAGIYLYRLVSFVLYETLRRPDLLERVTAEADAAFEDGAPGLEELRRMQTLEAVILEALRLYPLAIALPRVVAEPFEFGGFGFREGETIYIAGPATHFVPGFFPEPDRFDPERYAPARSEHRRPHAFAPFGFGAHACAARGYSQTLAAAIVAGIARAVRLRVHPEGARLRVRALPVPIPEAKFRVRVEAQREPGRVPAAAPMVRERLSAALWLLTPERRDAVFADLRHESFLSGKTIFRQGDAPDRFYVVQRGEVEVLLETPEGARAVARLGPGQHFGETGILQGVPRTATVRTVARTTVLSLGRESFNALAVEADVTRQELVALMERRALVNGLALALPRLAADAAGRLAAVCATRNYPDGTAIVTQGEEADRFYLLLRGRVEVAVRPPAGTEFVVATLDAVDCFGEAGILLRRLRSATVRALGPVTVLEVPREHFEAMVAGSAETGTDLARIATERLLALAEASDSRS